MKPIDKLAHKYALNINQIRGPTSSKKLDFKNLNIGFYDSIAKNDISIKKNQTILKRVKDSSMKEFIYSNREIPMNWKHKQDYRDNLLKIMVKDKKVLKYIGMGEYKEEDNNKTYTDRKVNFFLTRNPPNENEKILPNIKKTFDTKSKISDLNRMNQSFDSEKNPDNTIEEEIIKDTSSSKFSKSKSKPKHDYTEKEINNILEDFKINYPIKEKLKELYDKTNYYSSKSGFNNFMNGGKNMNLTTTRNLRSQSYINKSKEEAESDSKFNRNIFYNTIKNQQIFKRKNVIRQNVFNNLVSKRDSIISKSTSHKNTKKLNPIIFSDYKSFINKLKIKNPIVDKNLENINFYGPYFSYCPPCYNKNIEYYNNLEINQCIGLLHHIKKLKVKDNKKTEIEKNIVTSKETDIN